MAAARLRERRFPAEIRALLVCWIVSFPVMHLRGYALFSKDVPPARLGGWPFAAKLTMPRLIWADWIGLVLGFLIAVSAVMMSIILSIAAGGIADHRLYGEVANWTLAVEAVFVFPFWLILRGFDYLAGGPRRRRSADIRSEPSGFAEIAQSPPGPDESAGE